MRRFEDRAVLITGAASGIGRAVAVRLGLEGAQLVLADRDPGGLKTVADALVGPGGPARPIVYDAASAASSAEMVEAAIDVHGRLDAVLNIAGIYRRSHFADTALDDWERMLAINLTSVFVITQKALPALIRTRGAIVNTGSTAGLDGIAYAPAYAASKAAVINLTKSVAAEHAHLGVRANVVCPGRVKTAIGAGLRPLADLRPELANHPARLLGLEDGAPPEDLAGAYAYLASDDAAYVSGTVLLADGAKSAG